MAPMQVELAQLMHCRLPKTVKLLSLKLVYNASEDLASH